jgi:hypothetical protein
MVQSTTPDLDFTEAPAAVPASLQSFCLVPDAQKPTDGEFMTKLRAGSSPESPHPLLRGLATEPRH